MNQRLKHKTKDYQTLRIKCREKLHDTGHGNDFLDMTTKALAAKIDVYLKIFKFYASKDITDRIERKLTEQENICKLYIC